MEQIYNMDTDATFSNTLIDSCHAIVNLDQNVIAVCSNTGELKTHEKPSRQFRSTYSEKKHDSTVQNEQFYHSTKENSLETDAVSTLASLQQHPSHLNQHCYNATQRTSFVTATETSATQGVDLQSNSCYTNHYNDKAMDGAYLETPLETSTTPLALGQHSYDTNSSSANCSAVVTQPQRRPSVIVVCPKTGEVRQQVIATTDDEIKPRITNSQEELEEHSCVSGNFPVVGPEFRESCGGFSGTSSSKGIEDQDYSDSEESSCDDNLVVDEEVSNKVQRGLLCTTCGESFRYFDMYERHKCIDTSKKQFCELCDFTYSTNKEYNIHLKDHISSSTSLECPLCMKTFKRRPYLMVHLRSHSKHRLYECPFCDKDFIHFNQFRIHESSHSGVKPYKCGVCERTFTRSRDCKRHEELNHSGRKTCSLVCTVCSAKFNRLDEFESHKCKQKSRKKKTYQCKDCNITFKVLKKFEEHVKSHKRFTCMYCSISLPSHVELKDHEATHLGNDKPYNCKYCPKTFKQRSHVNEHERIHTGNRPFKCTRCDKTFVQKSHLTNHVNGHLGKRPYKCSFCDSTYKQLVHLKEHERSHAGTSLFKCRWCQKPFLSAFTLKNHEKLHEDEQQPSKRKALDHSGLISVEDNSSLEDLKVPCYTNSSVRGELFSGKRVCVRSSSSNQESHFLGNDADSGAKDENSSEVAEQIKFENVVNHQEYLQEENASSFLTKTTASHENFFEIGKVISSDDNSKVDKTSFSIQNPPPPPSSEESSKIDSKEVQQRESKTSEIGASTNERQIASFVIENAPTNSDAIHKCEFCPREFDKLANLKRHLYFCKSKKSREANRQKEDKPTQGIECGTCKETFISPQRLKEHELIHVEAKWASHTTPASDAKDELNPSRKFECSFCNKSFHQRVHLREHEFIHKGLKPHKCRFCEKSFAQAGNLKTHERIHLGEKRFVCRFCDKSFIRRNFAREHEVRMHNSLAHT